MFNNLMGAQDLLNRILNGNTELMSMVIVIILAFLVIYVSDFVMKRRRKELGLYSSLGMRNSRISRTLSAETGLVNIGALVVGVVFGQIFSLGLAFYGKNVFDIQCNGSLINFSTESLMQTLMFFSGYILNNTLYEFV